MRRRRAWRMAATVAAAGFACGTTGLTAGVAAAPPTAAAASSWSSPVILYAAVRSTPSLVRISLDTMTVLPPFAGSSHEMIPSPDGTVITALANDLRVFDAATGAVIREAFIAGDMDQGTLTADGRTLWYSADNRDDSGWVSWLKPRGTAQGSAIGVNWLGNTTDIVLTPDAVSAFFCGGGELREIRTANPTGSTLITLPGECMTLAMSPTGTELFIAGTPAADATTTWLWVLDLATRRVTRSAPLFGPGRRYIEPDMVVSTLGDLWAIGSPDITTGAIVTLRTADLQRGVDIRVTGRVETLAVTPDGSTAYVGAERPHRLMRVDRDTGTATTVDAGQVLQAAPIELMISPAQSPVAAFTAIPAAAGNVTTFDGSSSYGTSAPIVRWAWQFGDGSGVTRSVPTAKHTYAAPGAYTVRLTVTDAYGTSTTRFYDGTQLVRNGRPVARARQTVTIP